MRQKRGAKHLIIDAQLDGISARFGRKVHLAVRPVQNRHHDLDVLIRLELLYLRGDEFASLPFLRPSVLVKPESENRQGSNQFEQIGDFDGLELNAGHVRERYQRFTIPPWMRLMFSGTGLAGPPKAAGLTLN